MVSTWGSFGLETPNYSRPKLQTRNCVYLTQAQPSTLLLNWGFGLGLELWGRCAKPLGLEPQAQRHLMGPYSSGVDC